MHADKQSVFAEEPAVDSLQETIHKQSVFARESAVNSLKELIVLLTGLTITTGLGLAFASMLSVTSAPGGDYGQIWLTYLHGLNNEDRWGNVFRTALLIVCVLRFHHGNITILDDNYVSEAKKHSCTRNLFVDFTAMLMMSIGFSGMGFTLFHPAVFYIDYMVILVISVLWTFRDAALQYHAVWRHAFHNEQLTATARDLVAQTRWCAINIFTLILFISVFRSDMEYKSEVLAFLILVNSILDVSLTWRTLFPSLQPLKSGAAES
jgi:hypothetical protein